MESYPFAQLGEIRIENMHRLSTRLVLLTVLMLLLSLTLTACQSSHSTQTDKIGKPQSIAIQGLIFKNLSKRPVDKVTLRVAATRKFISCGYIATDSECSTRFPLKDYQGNAISVEWLLASNRISKSDFYVETSNIVDTTTPVYIVVSLDPQHQIRAEFIQ